MGCVQAPGRRALVTHSNPPVHRSETREDAGFIPQGDPTASRVVCRPGTRVQGLAGRLGGGGTTAPKSSARTARATVLCAAGSRLVSAASASRLREGGSGHQPRPIGRRVVLSLIPYRAFGLIGTTLSKQIGVFQSSPLKAVPISPNASYDAWRCEVVRSPSSGRASRRAAAPRWRRSGAGPSRRPTAPARRAPAGRPPRRAPPDRRRPALAASP